MRLFCLNHVVVNIYANSNLITNITGIKGRDTDNLILRERIMEKVIRCKSKCMNSMCLRYKNCLFAIMSLLKVIVLRNET